MVARSSNGSRSNVLERGLAPTETMVLRTRQQRRAGQGIWYASQATYCLGVRHERSGVERWGKAKIEVSGAGRSPLTGARIAWKWKVMQCVDHGIWHWHGTRSAGSWLCGFKHSTLSLYLDSCSNSRQSTPSPSSHYTFAFFEVIPRPRPWRSRDKWTACLVEVTVTVAKQTVTISTTPAP